MDIKASVSGNRATRVYSSTLGILVGLAGIEHGYFEILQGNVRPESMMIDAIGPEQRNWEFGIETALTVVPSFLVSGILAVILGALVAVWAYRFVDRKAGPLVLLVLSVLLWLVGGGFAPIFLTVLAFLGATRVHKPLSFWRARASQGLRRLFATLWPWSLIVSVVSFAISVEIAIFGDPLLGIVGNAETTYGIQFALGLAMLILAILALPASNAQDAWAQEQAAH